MTQAGPKQRLGKWGETAAADFLSRNGYRLVAKNLRTPHGEIDLLVEKDGVTVFVEVKTRSGLGYGRPEEAVTREKQSHLLAAIAYYWQTYPGEETDWRVDVVAVVRRENGKEVEIVHFENAIG